MKKPLMIGVIAALVCVLAAGTTLAWLTASAEVSNTFTVGKIAITLTEGSWTNNSKIYPGAEIDKDPQVKVTAGSEDCYVYVMVDNQLGAAIVGAVTLDTSPDWTAIRTSGTKTVYRYKAIVPLSSTDTALTKVFTKVKISSNLVTETNISLLDGKKIDVKAFAHQSNAILPGDADAAAYTHFGV